MSLEPGAVGITSTTSAPTSSSRDGDLAAGPEQVGALHPAGLGRAGAGRVGRIEHVHVDAQEDRPGADDIERAADDLLDPEPPHVVHEEARDPALVLPGELLLAGPVAAQADLDVAARVDHAGLDEPVHRRAVRDLDAEDLAARCPCACRSGRGRAGRGRAAQARMSGSAIEWSPPSTTGIAPAATTSPTVRSIAACVRDRVRRQHRRVAVVDHPQHGHRVDLRLEVRAGRAARRADRARAEAGTRPVGDEVVGRRADDRDVDAVELRRVLRVRQRRRT